MPASRSPPWTTRPSPRSSTACRATGTAVEFSERHRLPTRRLARAVAAAGVRTLAASDAYTARDVGRWQYLEELADDLAAAPAA